MLALWLIAIVIFVSVAIYMWARSKVIHEHTDFTEKFMKSHKRCEIYAYERYRYIFFFVVAVAMLILGIWFLFQPYIQPGMAYALIALSMALLALTQAMKDYYDHRIIFFNKGFVWEEQTIYFEDIEVTNDAIIDTAVMPLDRATVKEIQKHYKVWQDNGSR